MIPLAPFATIVLLTAAPLSELLLKSLQDALYFSVANPSSKRAYVGKEGPIVPVNMTFNNARAATNQ
ncbi:MAG: hypothetical protein HC888_17825 [Candidatus Competibacteraceae bacterium]|nr:hypothetical protein [Candidatus Competibacteraceae bacterium]